MVRIGKMLTILRNSNAYQILNDYVWGQGKSEQQQKRRLRRMSQRCSVNYIKVDWI